MCVDAYIQMSARNKYHNKNLTRFNKNCHPRNTSDGSVNSSFFLAPSRFHAFHLKCPAFFAYFEFGKMRSAQPQVEIRRLGNQLPVLGKANSLSNIKKLCVFCLLVKLRLSPGRVGPGIRGYRSSGKIRVASR